MFHRARDINARSRRTQLRAGELNTIRLESVWQLDIDIEGRVVTRPHMERAHIDLAAVTRMERVIRQVRAQVVALAIEIDFSPGEEKAAVLQIEAAHGEIDNRLQAGLIAAVLELGFRNVGVPVRINDDVGL